MSVKVRLDSVYKFGKPYLDPEQNERVWGILDPPDPKESDDDQFYTVRSEDRLDIIAHRMLGHVNYIWVIMHYNNIKDALDLDRYVDRQIRIPSRSTLERVYASAFGDATSNS